MKRLISLGALLLAVGCTNTNVRVQEIKGTSGGPMFLIDCIDSFASCEAKALQLCPNGYDRLELEHSSNPQLLALNRYTPQYRILIVCEATAGGTKVQTELH